MTSLTGRAPKDTYRDLLQVSNSNAGVDATLRDIEDGEGTASALKVSTVAVTAKGFTATDTNNNEVITTAGVSSAVNELLVTNAATGNPVLLSAAGGDTNIGLSLVPKGTGAIRISGVAYPVADGTSGQMLATNGSGVLAFASPRAGALTGDLTGGDGTYTITGIRQASGDRDAVQAKQARVWAAVWGA